jgi:hypothetical protein
MKEDIKGWVTSPDILIFQNQTLPLSPTNHHHHHKSTPSSPIDFAVSSLPLSIITMKAATSIILLTTALTASVSALGCYGGGQDIRAEDLIYHSGRACRGYDGKPGAFQGTFGPGETKSVCVDIGGNRVDMQVQNQNGGASFDIRDDDCAKELANVVYSCQYDTSNSWGGEFQNSGWWFRYVLSLSDFEPFSLLLVPSKCFFHLWWFVLTIGFYRLDPNSGNCPH